MAEKIQIQVEKGLTIINKMVKYSALTREAGMTPAWLSAKINHNVVNGIRCDFYEKDVLLINSVLVSIGERLMKVRITYSPVRETVVSQIKEVLKTVQSEYVYDKYIRKDKRWFFNRLIKPTKEGKKCSFTEDDILLVNLAVREVANNLLSIELIL